MFLNANQLLLKVQPNNRKLMKQLFGVGAVFLYICRYMSGFGQFCPFLCMVEFDIIKIIPISW